MEGTPPSGPAHNQPDRTAPANHLRSPSAEGALREILDYWYVLILREVMLRGTTRYRDFKANLMANPSDLDRRLRTLIDAQVMERRHRDEEPGNDEFILTEMGRELEPAMIALTIWELRWSASPDQPALFVLEDPLQGQPSGSGLIEGSEPLVIEIDLLGTFQVRVGAVSLDGLPQGSQRLLAFLALQDRSVARIALAGAMWPEVTDHAAGSSLRSALSRLDSPTRSAILTASGGLRLADAVVVDLSGAQALAHRLITGGNATSEADLSLEATTVLSSELLPNWSDDWVVAEAEDWRQLRVDALEAQAGLLIERARLSAAAEAAQAAIRVDPLRESAQARLIEVHLAEGNQSEALRVFDRYRALLFNELGLEPTPRLTDLVAHIRKP
jgi:DNA-binding SARP family transcriptional activator/DNA-binding HxlR family transcriptional regulator